MFGFRTIVNENHELRAPSSSRWMMNRSSPAKSAWNSAAFARRIDTIPSSFLSCSTPTAPAISNGRAL
jgi:hypothetical protein